MAYSYDPLTGTFKADTAQEIIALKREMDALAGRAAVHGAAVPAASAPAVAPPAMKAPTPSAPRADVVAAPVAEATNQGDGQKPVSPVTKAVILLEAIQDAGPQGLPSDRVQTILGADKPRGIGAKLRPVKTAIKDAGTDPEAAYSWERGPEGPIWKPGTALVEALEKLRGDR